MATDATLIKENGIYDIAFDESGDILTEQAFTTAILMSIFEERRASDSEVSPSQLRRGWIGNETTPDFEQGSKFWQFEQARVTGTMLADLGSTIRLSLQWLIDEDYALDVIVQTPFLKNGIVCVNIDLIRNGSEVEHLFFELWDNTRF